MGYAFISYSTQNTEKAEQLRTFFHNHHIETWMAPYNIPAGIKYAQAITSGIRECSCFVLLLSNASQASEAVDSEVELATLTFKKPIVTVQLEPVTLNDTFTFYIHNKQIIPVSHITENDPNMQKILQSVLANIDGSTVHISAPTVPAEMPKYTDPWKGRIALGCAHSLVLRNDGTVFATGDNRCGQCNVDHWTNIAAVAAGGFLSVGLRTDGTVMYAGNVYASADLSGSRYWRDMTAVYAGNNHFVALHKNTKAFSVGYNANSQCDLIPWFRITEVAVGYQFTAGLKNDGSIVLAGNPGDAISLATNWQHITAVDAGTTHLVGLRSNGTVASVGKNVYGECDTENWRDIISVKAAQGHTFGLKADGTVILTGQNTDGIFDVSSWKNVQSIAIGARPAGFGTLNNFMVGITSNGEILTAGTASEGQLNLPRFLP